MFVLIGRFLNFSRAELGHRGASGGVYFSHFDRRLLKLKLKSVLANVWWLLILNKKECTDYGFTWLDK